MTDTLASICVFNIGCILTWLVWNALFQSQRLTASDYFVWKLFERTIFWFSVDECPKCVSIYSVISRFAFHAVNDPAGVCHTRISDGFLPHFNYKSKSKFNVNEKKTWTHTTIRITMRKISTEFIKHRKCEPKFEFPFAIIKMIEDVFGIVIRVSFYILAATPFLPIHYKHGCVAVVQTIFPNNHFSSLTPTWHQEPHFIYSDFQSLIGERIICTE